MKAKTFETRPGPEEGSSIPLHYEVWSATSAAYVRKSWRRVESYGPAPSAPVLSMPTVSFFRGESRRGSPGKDPRVFTVRNVASLTSFAPGRRWNRLGLSPMGLVHGVTTSLAFIGGPEIRPCRYRVDLRRGKLILMIVATKTLGDFHSWGGAGTCSIWGPAWRNRRNIIRSCSKG